MPALPVSGPAALRAGLSPVFQRAPSVRPAAVVDMLRVGPGSFGGRA